MAKIEKRARARKHLQKGKRLEATRPLTVKGGASPTKTQAPTQQPYLVVKLNDVMVS